MCKQGCKGLIDKVGGAAHPLVIWAPCSSWHAWKRYVAKRAAVPANVAASRLLMLATVASCGAP